MLTHAEIQELALAFLDEHPEHIAALDAVLTEKPALNRHREYLAWFRKFTRVVKRIVEAMSIEGEYNFQVAGEALISAYSRIKKADETD